MSRLAPVVLAVSLFMVPAGCKQAKGIDIDAKQLIPAAADVAFGFQLDPLRKSPIGPALGLAMRGDKDVSAMMDAAPKCNVSLDTLHAFFAGRLEGGEDEFLAVVEAPGIGDEDIVRCMEDEVRKAEGGKSGLLLFSVRGDVSTTPQEGGGYLIILNKNAIAVVGRTWEDAVFAAIEQPSARNVDSTVVEAIAGIDTSAHLWMAAAIAEADVADTGVPGAEGIRSVAAAMSMATGIDLDMSFGFTDADKAGTFRTAMPGVVEEIGPALGEVGLPTDLLESLKLGGEGTVVSAKLAIGSEAMPGVLGAVTALMSDG